jgi:hypothetical protein
MKEDGGCDVEEAGLSSTRIGFILREVHVGFVVYKFALGHIYLRAFNLFLSASSQKYYVLTNSSVNDEIRILTFGSVKL